MKLGRRDTTDRIIGYRVRYTVTVDRPELRASDMPVVSESHRIDDSDFCLTAGDALRYFAALLRGESDCASEYVSRAEIVFVGQRSAVNGWLRNPVIRGRA